MTIQDKSIKNIINPVVIGQLEKGINKVQSSYIFHTLEEAKGYQTFNGGTITIITKHSELTTVEIVESYPKINDNEDLDSGTHRLRQESLYNIKDGLSYVKLIFGSKRIKYEEDKLTDKLILYSNLNVLHDTYAGTSIFLNELLKSEQIQQPIGNETKEQAATMRYEKRKEKCKHRTEYKQEQAD